MHFLQCTSYSQASVLSNGDEGKDGFAWFEPKLYSHTNSYFTKDSVQGMTMERNLIFLKKMVECILIELLLM